MKIRGAGEQFLKMRFSINIPMGSNNLALIKHYTTVAYNKILRKTVAVKNLKIGFQVFRQLLVAIRKVNIHSQRGHITAKFSESYFSQFSSSSDIEKIRK